METEPEPPEKRKTNVTRSPRMEARHTEGLLRRILEAGSDGILVMALDGRVLHANPAARALPGLEADASWPDVWTGETRRQAREAVAAAASGGEGVFHATAPAREGGTGHWEVTVTPVAGPDGEPELLLGVCRDVTGRRRAGEDLKTSRERFRAAFEETGIGMVLADKAGRLLQANAAFCRITGYPLEELLGRTSRDYTHPSDRGLNAEAIREVVEGRRSRVTYQKRYLHKNGDIVWAQISLSRLPAGEGGEEEAVVIGAVEDVTEQRHSRQALKEREQHLRLIFESVKDYAIFTVDPEGVVTTWNSGAERIFGWTAEEIRGRNSEILWTAEDRAAGVPARERRDARERDIAQEEGWRQRRDGSRFYASGTLRPMRDEAGGLIGFTKVCRDVTARLEAEEQLTAARARLAEAEQSERSRLVEAFERSPSFIAMLRGPEHVFEMANESCLRLVGGRDLLGKTVREALPEIDGQGLFELLDRVYATGERFVGNGVRALLRTAPEAPPEERFLDFICQPARDAEGAVRGLFVHGVDQTDRYRAERAQERLAEQRRLALDAAEMGWWHYDPVSGHAVWDDRVRAILDTSMLEMDYDKILELIHPDDRGALHAAIQEALNPENPRPYFIEYRVLRRDGSLRWVQSKGRTYFSQGPDRHAISLVGTALDVTETRLAQDALRESEARLRQLADAMPQIVFTARPDGQVDYFNRQWYDYTGIPSGATGNESWLSIHEPEALQRIVETWMNSVRTGRPYEIEYRLRRRDGEWRWHLGRALPVKDAAGNIVRWYGTNTDIHDYKELQRQHEILLDSERAARAEAERAGRMKDEFLATLSHELRTPLNAILGWVNLLQDGTPDPEELRQGLGVIERNARAQTRIIEDLLDMSRIISGRVRIDVQRVELPGVIAAAVEAIRPAAQSKNIQVRAVLDPLAGPVSGDPGRLQQVFWNLLSNAVKFTPRGGGVQVLLERVNSHLEIRVTDTGEGIDPDFLPYVFDRFRQADASITRRHGGLGLGLAIVKQLVELHGGEVRVKSDGAGRGACFIVSLPLTAVHAERETERRHPLGAAPEGGGVPGAADLRLDGVKVMIVDDEADARELLRRTLEGRGAEVHAAAFAAEALELIRQLKPDVLVSDIGMPGEDGYSLIRRVRALETEDGGAVPALALTAYARAEDRMKAIMAGFQMHLAKPVEAAELLTMVASLAGRMPK